MRCRRKCFRFPASVEARWFLELMRVKSGRGAQSLQLERVDAAGRIDLSPDLPTDRIWRADPSIPAEQAIAVIARSALSAGSPRRRPARKAGVHVGMPASERRRCSEVLCWWMPIPWPTPLPSNALRLGA